jgi:hypothetical protein
LCRLFLGDGGAEWFGGDERNRTAGLLLARQPLSQLSYIPEAAPGPPGVGRAAGDSNSQRPGSGIRHSHPGGPPCSWWSCQLACTFTRRWCSRRDGRTRTCDTQFWRLLFSPLNYIPIQTENRPLGDSPASGSWSGPSDRGRYPVAALWADCPLLPRAALTGEIAGVHAHRSSRSFIAVQSLT